MAYLSVIRDYIDGQVHGSAAGDHSVAARHRTFMIWHLAIVMILGGVSGGYIGARAALKVPPEKVRLLVSIIGFSMTAYFFLKYP